jgi:amino acid transporter
MTDRAPGARRNAGLVLMAVGVAFLLFSIVLSLGEATTSDARVSSMALIIGIAALGTGLVFYMLARSRTR